MVSAVAVLAVFLPPSLPPSICHNPHAGPKYCFMTANDTVVEMPLRVENFTRRITDHCVEFIAERAAARDRGEQNPWFFMLSFFHVHTPLFTNRTNRGQLPFSRPRFLPACLRVCPCTYT